MMPTPTFTLDELLAYLEIRDDAEGYLTTREWRDHLGVTAYRMQRIMWEAKARGILLVQKSRREGYDGSTKIVPVYAFDMEKLAGHNDDA